MSCFVGVVLAFDFSGGGGGTRVGPTEPLPQRTSAVLWIVHGLCEAAAATSVACSACVCGRIKHAGLTPGAAVGWGARWAHVHAESGAATDREVDTCQAANDPVARRLKGLILAD